MIYVFIKLNKKLKKGFWKNLENKEKKFIPIGINLPGDFY